MARRAVVLGVGLVWLGACGEDGSSPRGPAGPERPTSEVSEDVGEADASTQGGDSEVGGSFFPVFEQPYLDCREPPPGETGSAANGQVCTHVAISGCTEPGKAFAEYGSCEVVRTQRPFWASDPKTLPREDDPRLGDAAFMAELAWVTEQVEACACTCCHSSKVIGGKASDWDIDLGRIWTDTLSTRGLGLFTGDTDSSVLGAYPPDQNNGFDRSVTGVPTTDIERMRTFFRSEAERRGLSVDDLTDLRPFGGPLYNASVAVPEPCEDGVGMDEAGTIRWDDTPARYFYVLEAGSKNPGVPPNLDIPEGTLWRLDVDSKAKPITPSVVYGSVPQGARQRVPESGAAPVLARGTTYQLVVLYDVGLPIVSCLFTW